MAAETNVMQFDSPIDLIFKVDDSLGIVIKNTLMICSPFKMTRPLTGMHNSFFENSANIKLACSFFYDCSLAEQFLQETFPYPKVREYFFLVYDGHNFVVLDAPRSIIISTFHLRPEHNATIIGIAGHPTNLGEVAILTDKSILRIHIELDNYKLVSEIPLNGLNVYEMRPFLDGYLLQAYDELHLLNDNGIHFFKYIPQRSTILTDRSTIVCISPLKSSNCKIRILTTNVVFGLSSLQPNLVDMCHGYLISFHDSINLTFTNISDPKQHFSTTLSRPIPDPMGLYTGMNSTMDSIVVVVFSPKYGVCITIPLSELDPEI